MVSDRVLTSQQLEKLWFYVNFDCNLACRYCVARSGPRATRRALELALFQQLLDEAVALGFRQAVITGGEPLLNPDLPQILERATSRIDTLLLTNATLISPDSCSYLRDLSRQRLSMQVSLDSASPALHDRSRGKGSWKRTVEGIETLVEWGFDVGVRTTLVGQCDADVEALRAFLSELGIPEGRSYVVPVAKRGRSRQGLDLVPEELIVEPVVAADGLYRHPLLIDPCMAVTTTILPLGQALEQLARSLRATGDGDGTRRYR